jgi:hypothetical protein
MATEAAKVEAATKVAGEAPRKKKGKLLFVIIAVVLIGGGAGREGHSHERGPLFQI